MKFGVADLFSDHMVLRYNANNPVWGTADAGKTIKASFGGVTAECMVGTDGKWKMYLPRVEANIVDTLIVECDGEKIAFSDVTTGLVFLCGGQSNMEQPLMCVENGKYWAERATFSNVRLKSIPRRSGNGPEAGWHFFATLEQDKAWCRATRETSAEFSAVGFMFGCMVAEKLHLPVGLIDCNWGGTKIQSWLPTVDILAHTDTREDLHRYLVARDMLGDDAQTLLRAYTDSVMAVYPHRQEAIDGNLNDPMWFRTDDRTIRFVPEGADGSPEKPGSLFDNMLSRVAPFGIDAVLWYQGEANTNHAEAPRYYELFGRLLCTWRDAFENAQLPFFTCQLATFDSSIYAGIDDWKTLRKEQQMCADQYKNVSMAILLDVGMKKNIHPLRKEPVADRLARLYYEDCLHIKSDAHAPVAVRAVRTRDGIELSFDKPITLQEGEMPKTMQNSECVSCEICRKDEKTLLLKTIARADAVSYAQESWLVPSLFAENGDPVAPFELHVV